MGGATGSLEREVEEEVRENLFRPAGEWVFAQRDFPWHRDKSGRVTATCAHSSQALALDLFGTLKTLVRPETVLAGWHADFGLPEFAEASICPEYLVDEDLLGEPRPTQLDVLIRGAGALAVFECKFTESGGGSCSQTRLVPRLGRPQCTGEYVSQMNPVNGVISRCALSGKGIRYWDTIPDVLGIRNDIDMTPCPFRRGRYQWMRNVVVTAMLAGARDRPVWVLLYVEGPFRVAAYVAGSEWRDFMALSQNGAVTVHALSYQQLLNSAVHASTHVDHRILSDLREWVAGKIRRVCSTT